MSFLKSVALCALLLSAFAVCVFPQENWEVRRGEGAGDLISVFFTSSNTGWIAGDEGYLAETRDGGNSWTKRVLNTAANINEIYFRNDDNGYLVAGRKMFITDNGGKSWKEALIVNPDEFRDGIPEFLSIRFNSKKQGFIVGSIIDRNDDDVVIGSLVLRTTDGGESWTRVPVPAKVELFHLDFDGKSRGWIVGDKGTVLSTKDNGETWDIQETGTTEVLYNVDFRDENDGYIVGTNGTILRTEDGGTNWVKVPSSVNSTLFRVDFADDRNGWIVGARGTILRTDDKGKTWRVESSNTTNHLYGLYVNRSYGFSVGKDGIILGFKK
jgi:photosystem II stability/assembly factor-like uncharacterized protein